MNIDVRLLVGWVNSGGAKQMATAPAWIEMPANMPFYGSSEFKTLSVKMFLRKDFLEASSYDKVAIAIAHELSHVVLDSIHHPLRKEEKAVDLTAMLLGFSRLYMEAAHTSKSRLGYLTPSVERGCSYFGANSFPRHARTINVRPKLPTRLDGDCHCALDMGR